MIAAIIITLLIILGAKVLQCTLAYPLELLLRLCGVPLAEARAGTRALVWLIAAIVLMFLLAAGIALILPSVVSLF